MKKCPKCGAEIFFDDTTVCPKCGHVFTDASSDISSFPTPETVTKKTLLAGRPGGEDKFAALEKEFNQTEKEEPKKEEPDKEEPKKETPKERKTPEEKEPPKEDDDLKEEMKPTSRLIQESFALYEEENPCHREYREDKKKFEDFIRMREEEKEAAKGHGLNEKVRYVDSGKYSFPCFLLSMIIPPAGIILAILSIGRWQRFKACLAGMATGLVLYFTLGLYLYVNPHTMKAVDDFFSLFVPDKIITQVKGIYEKVPYDKFQHMVGVKEGK